MNNEKKEKQHKMRVIRIITLVIFAVIILAADICLILNHNRPFSERENRVLAQVPELTMPSLTSGKFMTKAEDFISDQFFLRDGWISYKLEADRILGKKESNGIFLGGNGYLLEPTPQVQEETLGRSLSSIREFALRHPELNLVMSIVPNAVCVLNQLVPAGAAVIDQTQITASIRAQVDDLLTYEDLTPVLKLHNTEYIYYKSDHHWTSLGARYAFEQLAPDLGITDPAQSYTEYLVTDTFSGTLASASGASSVTDQIHICIPDTDTQYVVEYVGESLKSATIYQSSALQTNSKYDVFLGGNHPLIKIRTTARNKKNLLLIKDSYANCLLQYLLPYFGSITIVDPRYYSDEIDNLITTSEITDVLILYNINTFVEDNSLASVLTREF
ncbi:MAG: hypothetical protein IJ106_03205 [Parasporobacterium sp.]|nr:hypothetical protein [Parasporobacterium sp.]